MLSCGAERRRRRKFSLFVVNFSRNFQNFGQKSQLSAKKSGTFWRRPAAKYDSLTFFLTILLLGGGGGWGRSPTQLTYDLTYIYYKTLTLSSYAEFLESKNFS
jgi:hypothetical protein